MLLDGEAIFASGPAALRVGGWPRQIERRSLPGLDGELLIDMGRRGRTLVQTGRLQAPTRAQLDARFEAIVQRQDSLPHRLTDDSGRLYPNILVTAVEQAGPVSAGRGFWVDYRIEYLQLP